MVLTDTTFFINTKASASGVDTFYFTSTNFFPSNLDAPHNFTGKDLTRIQDKLQATYFIEALNLDR